MFGWFTRLFTRSAPPGRNSPEFKKALARQFEDFATGDINPIEGALALLQTLVPEALPRLYQSLASHQIAVLVHPDAAVLAPLSINHPDGFRALVVFTREAKAQTILDRTRSNPNDFNTLKFVPFVQVLDRLKPGEGIIINPMDNVVRLDIPPDQIPKFRTSINDATKQNAAPLN